MNKETMDRWIETAKQMKATHIISVCDTFEYDDYPVYVKKGEGLSKIMKKYDGVNMQTINEVIDMKKYYKKKIL